MGWFFNYSLILILFIIAWGLWNDHHSDLNTQAILNAIDSMRTECTITAEPIDSTGSIKPDTIFIDCFQEIDTVDHYEENAPHN